MNCLVLISLSYLSWQADFGRSDIATIINPALFITGTPHGELQPQSSEVQIRSSGGNGSSQIVKHWPSVGASISSSICRTVPHRTEVRTPNALNLSLGLQ